MRRSDVWFERTRPSTANKNGIGTLTKASSNGGSRLLRCPVSAIRIAVVRALLLAFAVPTGARAEALPVIAVHLCKATHSGNDLVRVQADLGDLVVPSAWLDPATAGAIRRGEEVARPAFHVPFLVITAADVRFTDAQKVEACRTTRTEIVDVSLEGYRGEPSMTSPFSLVERARDNLSSTGRDFFQGFSWADHNLDGPITGSRDYFVFDDAQDATAMLRCSAWEGANAPPKPLCEGIVTLNEAGIGLRLKMPSMLGFNSTRPVWRDVAHDIELLLLDWRD